jgi:ParB-like chromosome segregation protein Spo0J
MFGQIRPIVVDENNEILAGNGLYLTLMRLGIEEARVYKYDDLTSAQKKKLMIADNKIFNLGIENMDTLNEFLSELQGDLDIPGYDEDILRQMFADADELTEQISNYGTLDQSEIDTIREQTRREEERENASPQPVAQPAPAQNTEAQETAHADDPERAETGRFVICPKCGERIWL